MIDAQRHTAEYMTHCELKGCGAHSRQRYDQVLRRFFRDCQSLEPAEVKRWMLSLISEQQSATVSLYKNQVRSFIKWAIGSGYIQGIDPFRVIDLPRINLVSHKAARKRVLSGDEYRRLLKYSQFQGIIMPKDDPRSGNRAFLNRSLHPHRQHQAFWYAAIVMGWHTGLRISDISLLRVDEYDRESEVIRITPYKTRVRKPDPIELPLDPEAVQVVNDAIDNRRPDCASNRMFPVMSGYYLTYRNGLLSGFNALAERAGIRGVTFHCLRHSFISRMLNAGVDSHIICDLTGLSMETIATYAHVSLERKRLALHQARLAEVLNDAEAVA